MTSEMGQNLTLHWRTVAIASTVLAVGALGALIVLVAVRGDPILSTTALILAILAFVIQIMVFVVETSLSHQQFAQSQQLNSETKAVLEDVRGSARSTHEVVTGQFDRMLDTVLSRLLPEAAKRAEAETGIDADEMQRILRDSVSSIRRNNLLAEYPDYRAEPTEEDARIRVWFDEEPPAEEATRLADELQTLPLAELFELGRFADDDRDVRSLGGVLGYPARTVDDLDSLVARNILETVPGTETSGSVARLTPHGRDLARLLLHRRPSSIKRTAAIRQQRTRPRSSDGGQQPESRAIASDTKKQAS